MPTMRDQARLALLVGLIGSACGPSLATVHEGAVRFEHCYGIDLDQRSQPEQRKACWQLWVASYTVGQPRDRIEYAQRRLHALSGEADADRPKLALDRDPLPEERKFYLVVPGPTSVHAPPPPIAPVVPATDGGEPADAAPPDVRVNPGDAKLATEGAKTSDVKPPDAGHAPPAERCSSACRSAWKTCDGACPKEKQPCTACQATYSACMRGCFD
jgi:hypothetical protein